MPTPKLSEDQTVETLEGPTPNGGVRSAAYYLDEQGNSAAKPRATAVEIVELDADDDVIHRTHGRLHPTSSQGE